MTKEPKYINVPDIGNVLLIANPRAKRMNLSIRPGPIIRLAHPPKVGKDKMLEFILRNKEWIQKGLTKYEDLSPQKRIEPGVIQTFMHSIAIQETSNEEIKIKSNGNQFELQIPSPFFEKQEQLHEVVHRLKEKIYRSEAKIYLPKRLNDISTEFKLPYNELRIKDLRSRWGSCSSKKNINLNYHLMKLPSHLIDYIIKHELCHTIHMNHGPNFKKLLNEMCGGQLSKFQKEIKQYRI